jgi:hypothetical protein
MVKAKERGGNPIGRQASTITEPTEQDDAETERLSVTRPRRHRTELVRAILASIDAVTC